MIELYSTNCPKCLVLEKKLDQAKIEYTKITDFDVQELVKKCNILSAPILKVDDTYMEFSSAVNWVNERNNI